MARERVIIEMVIMTVDCNKSALAALVGKLKKCYKDDNVIGFSDVREAEQYAQSHTINVLYTEVILNEKSGISFAKRMKELYPLVSLNFVSVTKAYAMEAIQIHADNYLLKPVSEEDIWQHMIRQ